MPLPLRRPAMLLSLPLPPLASFPSAHPRPASVLPDRPIGSAHAPGTVPAETAAGLPFRARRLVRSPSWRRRETSTRGSLHLIKLGTEKRRDDSEPCPSGQEQMSEHSAKSGGPPRKLHNQTN